MMISRSWLSLSVTLAVAACSSSSPTNAGGPPAATDDDAGAAVSGAIATVTPSSGSVDGGTAITLTGSFPDPTYTVAIGRGACSSVTKVDDATLTCVSTGHALFEETVDVTATGASGALSKIGAFKYACPWTWGTAGATSCGARPPAVKLRAETDAPVVTTFQAGHGFTALGAAASNMNDTSDFALGTQSAFVQTDGAGTRAQLLRASLPSMDFTAKNAKIWVKIENVARTRDLTVDFGDSGFHDYFHCRFRSGVEQPYTSEGDWVGFSIGLTSAACQITGSPDRAAVSAIRFAVTDDETGPVTLHVNGVSMVDDMSAKHPSGVVSFSFDDGYISQLAAAELLQANQMPGTAYIIANRIGDATHMTLENLATLQNTMGWEIAAHSYSDTIHAATFPATPAFDLEQDIVTNRAWVMSNGFNGYDDSAYPHGTYNVGGSTDVLSLMRKYYSVTRTVYSQMRESFPPSDPAKLRTYLVTSGDTAETVEAVIDEAIANRQWLILTMHHLVDPPVDDSDFSMTEFTKIVPYVKSKPIEVKTVLQMIQEP